MTIKFYDKIADLCGREGFKLVGSRLSKIIGSTRESDVLQEKIRQAKFNGLTRLEVSFRFDDSNSYRFGGPYMEKNFHRFANSFLKRIQTEVLNHSELLPLVFKDLDLLWLIHALATVPINVLIIGRTRVWLVNTATCHENHYIGTQRMIRLKPTLRDRTAWTALRDFVCRFSAPGSKLKVYLLSQNEDFMAQVCELNKKANAFF